MCGIRGSITSCSLGLMLVESLAVRVPVSRPGSGPFLKIISSPRVVPGVCEGIVDFALCRLGVAMFRSYWCIPNCDECRTCSTFPFPRYM